MTIDVPAAAPPWVTPLTRDTQREIDQARSPFISLKPFVVADLTAAMASLYPWKLAIVSDGAANKFLAISNGTAFYYVQGTAV